MQCNLELSPCKLPLISNSPSLYCSQTLKGSFSASSMYSGWDIQEVARHKKVLWFGNLSLCGVISLALPRPQTRDPERPEFCEWSLKGAAGAEDAPPFPKATNLLAERCRVSSKQQRTGSKRFVIGCGENLAGAQPEAPPPPGYPGYPPGSGLWKLLLTLLGLGCPGSDGRRDTLAIASPLDCTLIVPKSLSVPASKPRLRPETLPGRGYSAVPAQKAFGARICTDCSDLLVSRNTRC